MGQSKPEKADLTAGRGERQDTMSTQINRALFKQMVGKCRSYDPFTQYIDSYRQEREAVHHNKQLDRDFDDIMTALGIEYSGGIPIECVNEGAKTEECVERFLKMWNISVENEPVPAKRVWTEQEIRELVQTNDKVLYGALKNLYAQQTADEQAIGETRIHNNVGFNGADSKFLSSVAEFLKKTGFLTDKQKAVTRKKLVKYTKQLTRLANA